MQLRWEVQAASEACQLSHGSSNAASKEEVRSTSQLQCSTEQFAKVMFVIPLLPMNVHEACFWQVLSVSTRAPHNTTTELCNVQVQRVKAELQDHHRRQLLALTKLVSEKLAAYRAMLTALSGDVRAHLTHAHQDQSNTVKRVLQRVQQVRCRHIHVLQCPVHLVDCPRSLQQCAPMYLIELPLPTKHDNCGVVSLRSALRDTALRAGCVATEVPRRARKHSSRAGRAIICG